MSGRDEDGEYCRICGLTYTLRRDADDCENLHDEGF